MNIALTQKNLDLLVELKKEAEKMAEIVYKASKSNIENVSENLKELNLAGYDFRCSKFRCVSKMDPKES